RQRHRVKGRGNGGAHAPRSTHLGVSIGLCPIRHDVLSARRDVPSTGGKHNHCRRSITRKKYSKCKTKCDTMYESKCGGLILSYKCQDWLMWSEWRERRATPRGIGASRRSA